MLVSVIVPIYNVEIYLKNCIDSILMQTCSNFELILVDDGSPDCCGRICDDYARLDERIKVIHQKNGGLSCARNSGLTIANGEYVTFIDSDDFVFPHFLENLLKACQETSADMSVCSFIRCSENEGITDASEKECLSTSVFAEEKMKVFFTTKKIDTMAWGKLYKRSLFECLRYPVGRYNEDVFTTYKTVHFASRVAVCDYAGYVYRINENSIINEKYSSKKMDAVDGCLERACFIEKTYPSLAKYAYRDVVYACNRVVLSMGVSKNLQPDVLKRIQPLYRKYFLSYLFSKSSMLGKFFALVSYVNTRLGFSLAKIVGR